MSKISKVGLIGSGRIANYARLPSYEHMPIAGVVAVTDSIQERAKLTARVFGIRKWYNDYTTMVQDETDRTYIWKTNVVR